MKLHKVLITGPTGAVGISLIQELIAHNIQVTAICRPNSKRLWGIPTHKLVTVLECDLSSLSSLQGSLSSDYDAFYHFAWDGTYGDSRNEIKRQIQNIVSTIDAVHLAAAIGCKVFIGSGSQSEFGHVNGVLHPDLPCNPDTGYGIAKLAAGQLSRLECQRVGIRHVWCRIVSLYGPYDGPYTMVMGSILKMLKGERTQYTKGEQIWDYIYSKDAACAFRLIGEKGKDGAIYCLGTGRTRKLREYIMAIRDVINPELEIGIGELQYYKDQVMHLEADISNLTEDTGFCPKYSFEEGIRETVFWANNAFFMDDNTE